VRPPSSTISPPPAAVWPTQLDLFRLPAGRPTELGTGAAQIVGRDARNADGSRVVPKHLPIARNAARQVHRSKHLAGPLRTGQVSFDEAEHFLAQSRCQRRYAPMVFGIIPDLVFGFAGIPR
jgi:hypothetical protein